MDDLRPMLEEDKVEKGQDICTVSDTVLTCTMAIMPSAKPLPPFLQLICTTAAANDCTNPHFLT